MLSFLINNSYVNLGEPHCHLSRSDVYPGRNPRPWCCEWPPQARGRRAGASLLTCARVGHTQSPVAAVPAAPTALRGLGAHSSARPPELPWTPHSRASLGEVNFVFSLREGAFLCFPSISTQNRCSAGRPFKYAKITVPTPFSLSGLIVPRLIILS